jgi:hypothetical protein
MTSEQSSRVAIIAAVGGWGTAAITNWDKLTGGAASGSPFVHWSIVSTKVSMAECASSSVDVLQAAGPKKLEAPEERGANTRVADFGFLTGWISCITADTPDKEPVMYIGAAGDDFSDGQTKSHQLGQLMSARLSKAAR